MIVCKKNYCFTIISNMSHIAHILLLLMIIIFFPTKFFFIFISILMMIIIETATTVEKNRYHYKSFSLIFYLNCLRVFFSYQYYYYHYFYYGFISSLTVPGFSRSIIIIVDAQSQWFSLIEAQMFAVDLLII